MTADDLQDYRWLVSERAEQWLVRLRESTATLVQQTRQLRRALTAGQTRRLLELLELRHRGAAKFPDADRMFFTPRGLEQASDWWVARHKARRFPAAQPILDLCCGIGGDLIALAPRARVTAVDLHPVHALLADANCRSLNLPTTPVLTADATGCSLSDVTAWHIDPDRRRADASRTTRLEYFQPPLPMLEQMLSQLPHAAVKLAPASPVPPHWQQSAERQWIGSGRECRQQLIWFGDLAMHPGRRTAVVVDYHGHESALLVEPPDEVPLMPAERLGRFLYEPHAAVLAADLTASLADELQLRAVDRNVAYLTGDQPIDDLRISCFEILEVLPLDMRQLRQAARRMNIGHWEVKKRGVQIDPAAMGRRLRGEGTAAATLVISPVQSVVRALITSRWSGPESSTTGPSVRAR